MSTTAPRPTDTSTRLLEVKDISKTFEGARALDRVSLEVRPGEILAVVGHNGSGKSTLVKVLAGLHKPDDGGDICVRDARGARLAGAAAQSRLHFIHQDAGLIPMLSTIENFDLARPLTGSDLRPARTRTERRAAQARIARFGATFDVTKPVATLSPAECSIIAIARALADWDAHDHVLVLDEPTAALHGNEVGVLFEAVRSVAALGAGVIFISHRLDEVIDLADRVVALRDGRVVANKARGEADHDDLVRLIAGGDVERTAALATGSRTGRVVLQARGVSGPGVAPADLDLHAGEIVGLTGLVGSGSERLAALLFGSAERRAGEVKIDGRRVPPARPRASIRAGVAYVPADRHHSGAVMTMTGRENLTLVSLRSFRGALGRLNQRAERAETADWIRKVDVRPPNPERPLSQFSGGNQQKVVMAKWLRTTPKVMLLDEPTQGVDVGAKASIYNLVMTAAQAGAAVLVSSSEIKELVEVCDRVVVMRDGRIVSEVRRPELTEPRLVREILGVQS